MQEQERSKGVQSGSDITEDLNTDFDSECDSTECFAEFEPVVPFAGFGEPGEFTAAGPVEFARVDDDAADGGSVPSDPFRGGVDDDVGSVGDGSD